MTVIVGVGVTVGVIVGVTVIVGVKVGVGLPNTKAVENVLFVAFACVVKRARVEETRINTRVTTTGVNK